MNDKVKSFIKEINTNEELKKQFIVLNEKINKMTDRDEAIKQYVLPFAKTCGYDLTAEDFSITEGEMNEDELKSVSGGSGGCGCPVAGCGVGHEEHTGEFFDCLCAVGGTGTTEESNDNQCICCVIGGGTDN